MSERRHCDRCGGPIRYDESEPSPGWLHIDQSDDKTCPLEDEFLLIRPAPTRAALAQCIADTMGDAEPSPADFAIADAVLAEFWPDAVSDSQETPG